MKTDIRRLLPRDGEIMQFAAAFLVVFVAAKFGQYLFFDWKTSPAILWPPTGIALALIWMWGYKYAVPIFVALVITTLTGPFGILFPNAFTTPFGQVLGSVVGVYLLRRYQFDGTFSTMRNVLTFLIVIIVACAIAPTITTFISYATGHLTISPYVSWSRVWAGYVFSCLILFPFLVSWSKSEEKRMSESGLELAFVWVLLLSSVYFLFWTRVSSEFSFLLFAFFFIAHIWTCLRFSTRVVALGVFITTFISILGLFISPDTERMLSSQLIGTELFLFLVVPIFYAFSALVKERANTILELKEAFGRIEKESLLKNDFIAVLAHELRNPLAPIKTTLEILSLEDISPDLKLLVKNAHMQLHSMRRLLDDLLDSTRVSQGRFKLQISRANLCAMIQHSIDSTKEMLEERQHTLIFAEVCDDSIWIDVDPVRFEQVIVNILNNAAKYTNIGGRIVIQTSTKDGMAVIKITDNGIGIDRANLKDVFQSFWQVESSLPHAGSGIGIGLSLTKKIVEMHSGTISVESEGLNKGSTFTVMFPLSVSNKTTLQKIEAKPIEIPPFKILVADDNIAAANALSKLLTMKGHSVEKVYSGKDVLVVAATFKPAVVLLDIGLPDMSGYEVAQLLRANGYLEKIVALTGYGQKEDLDKAFESGFDYHLTKPMTITRLEEYLISIA